MTGGWRNHVGDLVGISLLPFVDCTSQARFTQAASLRSNGKNGWQVHAPAMIFSLCDFAVKLLIAA
ncbi:MAG: hypothetical protein WCJ09_20240 [Planctomycetota bacterium]